MSQYRDNLPQLSGDLYLTDAGIETDLIFNHGIEIREFAAHTLLPDPAGREAMADYFRGFLALANEFDAGYILDSQTWKAHMHWAGDLGEDEAFLHRVNEESIRCRTGRGISRKTIRMAGRDGRRHDYSINLYPVGRGYWCGACGKECRFARSRVIHR